MGGMGPVQPTEPYFNKGLWGWSGSQWRKLSLLWGYTDRLAETVAHVKVGGGNYVMAVGTVPAGEVWTVNAVFSINQTSLISQLHWVKDGTDFYYVKVFTGVALGVWSVTENVRYVLKEDDSVGVLFWAAIHDDSLIGQVWGTKQAVM